MPPPPTPALRLVVDNSPRFSSPDSAISASSAQAMSSSLTSAGMPLFGQLRIPDSDKPNLSATALTPPKGFKSMFTSLMPNPISRFGTFINPKMGHTVENLRPFQPVTREGFGVTIWDMPKHAVKPRPRRKPKPAPYAEVGQRLRLAREALTDESAKDFANAININPQTYRNYERGDRKLDYDAIQAIAASGISLYWIFFGAKPMLLPLTPAASELSADRAQTA